MGMFPNSAPTNPVQSMPQQYAFHAATRSALWRAATDHGRSGPETTPIRALV
jgi:hypothetical protein